MIAEAAKSPTARRGASRLRTAVRSIAATLLVLLAFEAAIRVAKTIRDDWSSGSEWLLPSSEVGWTRRPGFDGVAMTTPRTFDGQGFFTIDTPQVTSSRPKIICLGDSNTFGWEVEASAAFAELLDRRLPDMDVINLGVIGYSSFQGLKVLKGQGLALDPAIVVASFNHNDRAYVLDESGVDGDKKFAAIGRDRWRKQALNHFYLLRMGAFGLRKLGLMREKSWSGQLDLATLRPRVSPESYRSNLVEMIELTQARGIPLVFILLKDNPVPSGYLREGADALERGDHELAAERLAAAVALDNGFSDLARVYSSRVYEALGDHQRALSVRTLDWQIDSSLGGRPIRLDTEYNEIMLEVAETFSIPLVDAGTALNVEQDIYVDNVHPNARGHQIIADLLYQELAGCCLGGEP